MNIVPPPALGRTYSEWAVAYLGLIHEHERANRKEDPMKTETPFAWTEENERIALAQQSRGHFYDGGAQQHVSKETKLTNIMHSLQVLLGDLCRIETEMADKLDRLLGAEVTKLENEAQPEPNGIISNLSQIVEALHKRSNRISGQVSRLSEV